MRILLIDPPYERLIGFRSEWFPLGPASIAGFLAKNGYPDVRVYHAEHAPDTEYKSVTRYAESFKAYGEAVRADSHPVWDEIEKVVREFQPDVVGISVLTPKVPSVLRVAEICGKAAPTAKIVCGGSHATTRPAELLDCGDVDYVIRGEGETPMLRLMHALESRDDVRDIPALSYRDGEKIVDNPPPPLIPDVDDLPPPARELILGIEGYSPSQLNMVLSSRGCPFDCGFCASKALWRRKVRFRSVGDVMAELRELKTIYGVTDVAFLDDSFTLRPERVRELCEALIESRLDIRWSCLTRVDMITEEVVRLMKRAGCAKVDVGVESGSPRVLELIDKKISLDKAHEAAAILRRCGMYWSAFFMFGFPTETEGEIEETLKVMRELDPDWANMSIFTPYPGTKLFDLAKEKGMVSDPPDYTLYSHQNPSGRFTDVIPAERFEPLARRVLAEVHSRNSSLRSLGRRALTRGYHRNPGLLLRDLKKVLEWIRPG